jgi:hypothetical protein
MNAAFFGLAGLAALNPKLLIIDLILTGNQRPRPMFLCFLLGGVSVMATIGLLDVLVLQADAVKVEGQVSAQLELIFAVPLLIVGALLAVDRPRTRRREPHPRAESTRAARLRDWADRSLHEPRYGLAIVIGAAVGTPGGFYIIALHELVTGSAPAAVQVAAVFVFVLINFSLVIVPFALYLARPERAEATVVRLEGWLTGHSRQIAAAITLGAGAYLLISGVLRLT